MKAINALGLLALLIGATFAEPLSTAELEPDTGDRLHLMYDFEQPLTGGEDPQLLAATTKKVLELARKQFARTPAKQRDLPWYRLRGRRSLSGAAAVDEAIDAEDSTSVRLHPARNDDHPHQRPPRLAAAPRLHRTSRPRLARIYTSLFLGSMSGAGWRCEAVRKGAQWIIGPCRLMWTL